MTISQYATIVGHMKRLQIVLLAVLINFVALSPAIVLTGCKTPSVQKQSVTTLWSLGKTVDTTYRAYLDLVIAGKLPTNSVPKVSQAYGTFQKAFKVGVELVASNTNAFPPQVTLDAAAAFNTEVNNAKKRTP